MQIKGSKMLKVVSIIYVTYTILRIISVLILAAAAIFLSKLFGNLVDHKHAVHISLFLSAAIVGVLVFGLFIGILGIKNCNNPQGAGKCFVFGIVVLALMVVSTILNIVAGSFQIYNLLGFVILGLYTYAAFQVKSSK